MTQETTKTTMNKVYQGYEYSNFFHLTNDFAGYIDFEGILLPTSTEGEKEVKATISFEVHESARYANDHSKPPLNAYMTLREQKYIDGENRDLTEPRNINLTVEAAKEILRTWGQTVHTV